MNERLNLVTGACGFTGSNLVKYLLDQGESVVATDLPKAFESEKNALIFEHIGLDLNHPRLIVKQSDLTDRGTLDVLFEEPVTHVFHTASLYDYSAPMELLVKVNIDGFSNLLDAIEHTHLKRFIHWSTCGVFGHPYRLSHKKGNLPFTEKSPSPKTEPLGAEGPSSTYLVNDYSITKWRQEQMAWRAHRENGLPLTVIRPAPIYGPGSDYGHGGIIINVYKGRLYLIPRDARNYITTSVHVRDVVRFACFVADRDDAIGEDFNVVDDSIISDTEFLKYIGLLVGRHVCEVPGFNMQLLMPVIYTIARGWLWMERKWHVPRPRMLEVGSARYIGSSYWISNKKTKDWGFTYRYPDVREGLRDTIQSFREIGWL